MIKHNTAPALSRTLANATLEIIAQHGMDPATKAQAAAHEAGHVIVAHAVGWTVKSAKLFKRIGLGRVFWGGMTYHSVPGYEEPKAGLVSDDPLGAFHLAINALAGFFGEVIVGLDHPASSIDERYYAMSIAAELDKVWGKTEGHIQLQLGDLCSHVIEQNRQQFEIIRTHLHRAGRLTRHDAKRILTQSYCFDLNAMLSESAA